MLARPRLNIRQRSSSPRPRNEEQGGGDDSSHVSEEQQNNNSSANPEQNENEIWNKPSFPQRISFNLYDQHSWEAQVEEAKEAKEKAKELEKKPQELHLKDGQLKLEDESQELIVHKKKPNPELVEGKVLPSYCDIVRSDLMGKPLEEIDENLKAKTFVVIASRFTNKYIFRFSSTKSLYLFSPWDRLRKWAVYITTNQFFDYFIILTIICNCVFLTMPDLEASEIAEYVFLAIYLVEMIMKIIARGIILKPYTYLRDPWNWLDFLVILLALSTIIVEASLGTSVNLQGLRTFRVFRALRTISILPGLKTIVNALLRAFKLILEVLMLLTFCLMVFALFGLQIYTGILRQKCVLDVPEYNSTVAYSYDHYYNDFVKNTSNWYEGDDWYLICGNATGSGVCPSGYTCLENVGENPNFGYTSFDNFGWSMLTSLQLITLDFWEDTYDKVIRAGGPWNTIFFTIVVFFGSFYLVNLMVAVVALSYELEAQNASKEQEEEERRRDDPWLKMTAATKAAAQIKEKVDKKNIPTNESKENSSTVISKGTQDGTPQKKVIPRRNPMIKMASKDSGYSIASHASTQSTSIQFKHQDSRDQLIKSFDDSSHFTPASSMDSLNTQRKLDSGTGSISQSFVGEMKETKNYKFKKPFVKQASVGIVSGVQIEKDANDNDGESHRQSPDIAIPETKVCILKAQNDDSMYEEQLQGMIIDRNCKCCERFCQCFVPWLKIQNAIYLFVSDPLFDFFITVCIILNTVFMATERHGQSDEWTLTLKVSNYVFTAIFILEAVLKIAALSKMYFQNGWNNFDLVIVVASIVDMGVEGIDGLNVLRTFRLLRVFKLAQAWPTMRILLSIIINALGALGNLTIILGIIIYIFAVIGLQLFNKKYTPDKFDDGVVPRWNFNDFIHSFMMVFRVLCGEWIEPLWDCMTAADETCMVVFLPAFVFGNFIVLNLFLALLLNAFASDTLRKHKENMTEVNRFKAAWYRVRDLCNCFGSKNRANSVVPTEEVSQHDIPLNSDIDSKSIHGSILKIENTNQNMRESSNKVVIADPVVENGTHSLKTAETAFQADRSKYSNFEVARTQNLKTDSPENSRKNENNANGNFINSKMKDDNVTIATSGTNYDILVDCFPICCTKRCGCCERLENNIYYEHWFNFRLGLQKIVGHKVFEGIVMAVIIASSVSLAFEDVYMSDTTITALYYLNIIFCSLFLAEMLIKWFALGFKRYFTSFWTCLDFIIVVISILSLVADSLNLTNVQAFRSLRTLRALRPLRAVSRWQGMKVVVNALVRAIPAIVQVLMVCIVFWLIFSIMGVQFFAGKFSKCVDSTSFEILSHTVVANKSQCLQMNQTWMTDKINFDDVLNGYLALFQVATFEGWMEVMAAAIDSTEVDVQPIKENNVYYYFYFVGFIVFGSFFTLNLFIGVIIDNFNALKKKYEGGYLDMFLTESQKNYYTALKKLGKKKPQKTIRRPKNRFHAVFYDVAVSGKFEIFIMVIIFANMVTLAMEHYKQPQYFTDTMKILNIVFTIIFILEAAIKISGTGLQYFRQPWNVFDFIIVVLSFIGILMDDVLSSSIISPTLLRVLRVFRIGRVLRLVKAAKGIRKLLFALIISLPALFNVGALLFLVMYIYAIVGMSSFGDLKLTGRMDEIVNFQTFGNSFMLLIRLATSAGWNDILEPMLIEPPYCNDTHVVKPDGSVVSLTNGDCGTPWLAILFMTSYILIIFLIVINMYIAVILENFNTAHQAEEVGITEDDFDMFYVIWERYDPLATQFIKYDHLSSLVADLDKPLGIPKPNEIALVAFDLPIVEGDKIHCLDILMALVKYAMGDVEETEELQTLRDQMEIKFREAFPNRVKTTIKSSTMQKKKEDVAARTLQRSWKRFKMQRQLKSITQLAMLQSASKIDPQAKATGITGLGQRLSNALSSFFNPSRPGSAMSRSSIRSIASDISIAAPQSAHHLNSTLEVPTIGRIYPPSDSDSNATDL